jgi:hypothetical protein
MKAATSPNGTGGNPKIGIPVCLQRSPSPFFYPPSCLLSSSPSLSFLPHSSQDSGLFSAPLLSAAPVFPFASCMYGAPDDRAPPLPIYSINIKIIFYLMQLTPMKTFEHPPCQRRSLRLRPKASPAYARGPASHLTLNLVLCLGPLPLSPRRMTPFPLTRLMVSYPRLVPPPTKTGSDKTLSDRIIQDHSPRQDPLHSAPPILLLPHDLLTPTPSNLYL